MRYQNASSPGLLTDQKKLGHLCCQIIMKYRHSPVSTDPVGVQGFSYTMDAVALIRGTVNLFFPCCSRMTDVLLSFNNAFPVSMVSGIKKDGGLEHRAPVDTWACVYLEALTLY